MLTIHKIAQEFPNRVVEWGISYIMLTWGCLLISNAANLTPLQAVFYAGWLKIMPLRYWGLSACAVSIVRIAALYINGAHKRSPLFRMGGGLASMLIWMLALVAVQRAGIMPSLALYFWLAIGDGYAVYVASGDAYTSKRKELAESDSRNSGLIY